MVEIVVIWELIMKVVATVEYSAVVVYICLEEVIQVQKTCDYYSMLSKNYDTKTWYISSFHHVIKSAFKENQKSISHHFFHGHGRVRKC